MTLPIVKPWIYVIAPGCMTSLNASGRSVWTDDPIEEDTIVFVFDVDAFPSIEEAALTVMVYPRLRHLEPQPIYIAAVGHKGGNMNPLLATGRIRGIVQRPDVDGTFAAWNAALQPLLIGLKFPDYEDTLDPSETGGGVSQEEFAETLRRAARGDRDG